MNNIKWFIISGLVLLVLGFALGYFVFPKVEIRYTVREVDVDSTEIFQEARLGWISEENMDVELSKAYNALKKEKDLRPFKSKFETRYNFVDSVVVRDSVAVTYIPFFGADTNFTFEKKTDRWEFDTNIGVKTKFYPGVNLMQTKATMNSLNITVTYEQPWGFDYTSGGIGFIGGALFTGGVVYLTK